MRSQTRKTTTLTLIPFVALAMMVAPITAAQQPGSSGELTEEGLARLVATVQKEVEELRGWKYKHPVKAALYTQEELHAFLEGDAGDGWGEEARAEAAMTMIGLFPPDDDAGKAFEDAMTGFVPGIYDHKTHTLGIVTREDADYTALNTRVTIAHELIHALDDQYFNLEKLMAEHATLDAAFALGAVVEGSAVTLQERYENKAIRSGDYDQDKFAAARGREMEGMKALFEAPPFVRTYFLARFPNGICFLQRGDMKEFASAEGPKCAGDTVRAAFLNLPRSSEQILHPKKYWREEKRDEPVIVNDRDVEKLLAADGLHIAHKDTIGELLCAVLTTPEDAPFNPMAMMAPGGATNAAARGWGGDRLFLLSTEPVDENAERKPDKLLAVWLTMWDTPDDCEEFVEEYEALRELPSRTALRLGEREAVFLFGFDDDRREKFAKQLRAAPPRYTRDQKPWRGDNASRQRSRSE